MTTSNITSDTSDATRLHQESVPTEQVPINPFPISILSKASLVDGSPKLPLLINTDLTKMEEASSEIVQKGHSVSNEPQKMFPVHFNPYYCCGNKCSTMDEDGHLKDVLDKISEDDVFTCPLFDMFIQQSVEVTSTSPSHLDEPIDSTTYRPFQNQSNWNNTFSSGQENIPCDLSSLHKREKEDDHIQEDTRMSKTSYSKDKCPNIFYNENLPGILFPCKLYDVLERQDLEGASWHCGGTQVLIKPFVLESELVSKKIFRLSNIRSFIRQLNKYGFRKVKIQEKGPISDVHFYYHKNFQRYRLDLLAKIHRR